MTALQALALLNDPFVLRQAERYAARLAKSEHDLAGQVRAAYQGALSRPPSELEADAMADYARRNGMTNVCRLIFNMSEFLFVD